MKLERRKALGRREEQTQRRRYDDTLPDRDGATPAQRRTGPYYPDVVELASELIRRRAVNLDELLLDGRLPAIESGGPERRKGSIPGSMIEKAKSGTNVATRM